MGRGDVVQERQRYQTIRKFFWWPTLLMTWICVLMFVKALIDMHAVYGMSWPVALIEVLYTILGVIASDFGADHWFVSPPKNLAFFHQFKIFLYIGLAFAGALWYYLLSVSFRCPHCTKVIDINSDWMCPSCDRVHYKPWWFTLFHRCRWRKCKTKPPIYECPNPNCRQDIYLLYPAPEPEAHTPGESPTGGQSNVARLPVTRNGGE